MASALHNPQLRNLTTMKTNYESIPRQSVRSALGNTGTRVAAPSHSVADFRTGESFNHLKLTAEKMIQEQACAKSDLQILKTKLQKSEEQVRTLESKVEDMHKENAMLKLKAKEDMKLWKGLDSKFLATTTFCNQVEETLQLLKPQVQEAEHAKSLLEDKLAERVEFFEKTKFQVDDLIHKKQIAEDCVRQCETRSAELQLTVQELEKQILSKKIEFEKLAAYKDDLQQQMNEAMKKNEEDNVLIRSVKSEVQDLQKELVQKALDMINLQNANLTLMQFKGELELQVKDLESSVATEVKENESLQQKLETLNLKISELDKENDLATGKIELLLVEKEKANDQARHDKADHTKIVKELKQYIAENEMDSEMIKHQLQEQTQEIERLVKLVADNSSKFAFEVNQMREESKRKDQLLSEKNAIESSLRAEIEEIQAKLAGLESDSKDLKKRFKIQLEAKQTELVKHLQEISQRNNQEMTDMRRKYEAETREAIAEERLKGECTLEAVKKDCNDNMKKEVEALNQRLKVAVTDHDHAVNRIRKLHEQEKSKIVALHAEEIQQIQLEFRAEMEKRISEIENDIQAKIEESHKLHDQDIEKLREEHQEQLLKMTKKEEYSLQLTVAKMHEAHKEELARRTEEHKLHIDMLEKQQREQLRILQTSSAKNVDEWKSKALSWEVKLKETVLIMTAKQVSKEDKQTQITESDVDLNMTTTESRLNIVDNIRTPMAKDKEQMPQSQRSGKRKLDLASTPEELAPNANTQGSIVKEKDLVDQVDLPTQILPNTTPEDSAKHLQGFKQASILPISATVSQQKMTNIQNIGLPQRPKVYGGHHGITVELGSSTDNAVALQAAPSIQKWSRRREIQEHGPTLEQGKKTITRGRRKLSEEPVEDSIRSSKRVKFNKKDLPKSKSQQDKQLSPVIDELFQMDDLDPYYKGDDPYAFQS